MNFSSEDHKSLEFIFRGPDDNGLVVDGPGRLAKKAFENGALYVMKAKHDFSIQYLCRISGTRWKRIHFRLGKWQRWSTT